MPTKTSGGCGLSTVRQISRMVASHGVVPRAWGGGVVEKVERRPFHVSEPFSIAIANPDEALTPACPPCNYVSIYGLFPDLTLLKYRPGIEKCFV